MKTILIISFTTYKLYEPRLKKNTVLSNEKKISRAETNDFQYIEQGIPFHDLHQ